ncbi:MAG: anaerobic sulfatase maturase [Sarcina sp.]
MRNIVFLIKPVGSVCNINCEYCFYKEITKNRMPQEKMTKQITELFIKNVFIENYQNINFAFQGGEPTLAGIEYFKAFINLVEKYNIKNINILYSLQTNAYNLSEEFILFFKENKFLLGVSLDGNEKINDSMRKVSIYKGSFKNVLKNIKLLEKYKVDFNILSVITKYNYKHIEKIYNFFKKENLKYLQFIPCIDNLDKNEKFTMSNDEYFSFLDNLFKLYINDYFNDEYISIREFDNYVQNLLNNNVESCALSGVCGIYFVVESNGDIYPCDFYAMEEYKLGNIKFNKFSSLESSNKMNNFITESKILPLKCKACKYFRLCKGGCKRQRIIELENEIPINKYCRAYYKFFEKNIDGILKIVKDLS